MLTAIFAGFPLGVKSAVDMYKMGVITRDELERLAPVINLPSLAFVISGVGLGLYNDIKTGFLLYFSLLSASVTVGFINGINKANSRFSAVIPKQTFNLTISIKQAGESSITISSYIIFFSGLIGLISALAKNNILSAIISSFFEIGNATLVISKTGIFSNVVSLVLTAFALGFSGFSVHFQAFAFLPSECSRKKYLFTKLVIGILSSFFTIIIITIIKLH